MGEPNLAIVGILGTVLIGVHLVAGIMLRDVWEVLKFAGIFWGTIAVAFGITVFWAWIAGGFNA